MLKEGGLVILVALVGLLCSSAPRAEATLYVLDNTMNWQSVLGALKAGDTAMLHEGTYTYSNSWNLHLAGTSGSPITITGFKNESRPHFLQTNTAGQNNLDVDGSWITMDYLEFTGGNEGIRIGPGDVTDSTFTNLQIHDTFSTGFTANFGGMTSTRVTISYNEVWNTGSDTSECFYLGCSSAGCTFHDGHVHNNYCHDTNHATSGSMGSGIQIKTGSYNNIVQDNVCYNTGGPCVLAYDDYDKGVNQIIGNLVILTLDNGIQATSGVKIVNNIVIDAKNDGIAIVNNQLESGKLFRNVEVVHNTVLNTTSGACLRLTGTSSTANFLVANNALYCPTSTNNIVVASYSGTPTDLTGTPLYNNVYLGGNVPANAQTGGLIQSTGLYADLIDPSTSSYNLYPVGTGALPKAGNPSHSFSYDYNGTPRSSSTPTIGAYEYTTASNPGTALGPGFKGGSSGSSGSSTTTTGSSSTGSASSLPDFKGYWLKRLRNEFGLNL